MKKNFVTQLLLLLLAGSLYGQAIIKGTIVTKKNEPVIGANIYIKGSIEGTNSDENGKFTITTNINGDKTLVVSCIGFKTHEENITLHNQTVEVKVLLSTDEVELREVTVYASTFEAGDKKKSVVINRVDMATSPTGFGDALSLIRTLPGTTNSGDEGGLMVRGGEQNETKTFIDGLTVQSPYTAKMPNVPVRGRFSPMLFRGTVFSTGGYSAEYGQALSSVLLLSSVDTPEKDENGFSLFSSGVSINSTKKWERSSLSASWQYINMAPTYKLIKSNIKWEHAPEEFSQMITYRHCAGKRGLIKIITNVASDKNSLNYRDIYTWNYYPVSLKNNDLFLVSSYRGTIGKDILINTGISFNFDTEKTRYNQDNTNNKKSAYELKLSLSKPLNANINLKFGTSVANEYYSRTSIPREGDQNKWQFYNPIVAFFAESEIRMSSRLSARIGGRTEYISLSDEKYISPRLSMAYKTSSNSQLSIGYGSFSEQPLTDYIIYSNKLKSEKAGHYIFNYQLSVNSRIFRIEAYYKKYSYLVKYDSLYATDPGAYDNSGKGYARGIDLFYRDSKTIKNGDFWISYSFIDSKRNYRDYTFSHVPLYLSKHNLSVVYKHYISLTDSYISAGYEYAGGRPYIDPNVSQNEILRTKPYSNLNISLFQFTRFLGKFTMIFVQVNNILGNNNIYGYRYSRFADIDGRYMSDPILPVSKRSFLIGLYLSFTGKPEV